MTQDFIAQAFGIVGMTMNILSFQMKKQKNIIFMQLIGSTMFCLNYFLLGAASGALLNIIGILRAVVYWKREFFKADKIIWVYALSVGYVAAYFLSFVLFGTERTLENYVVELLPVVGMMLTTVSFYFGRADVIRYIVLINNPLWLTYNIINLAIGGIICESVAMCSAIIGIFRYDIKGKRGNKHEPVSSEG